MHTEKTQQISRGKRAGDAIQTSHIRTEKGPALPRGGEEEKDAKCC